MRKPKILRVFSQEEHGVSLLVKEVYVIADSQGQALLLVKKELSEEFSCSDDDLCIEEVCINTPAIICVLYHEN